MGLRMRVVIVLDPNETLYKKTLHLGMYYKMLPFEVDIEEQLHIENQINRERRECAKYKAYQITMAVSCLTLFGYAFYYEYVRKSI